MARFSTLSFCNHLGLLASELEANVTKLNQDLAAANAKKQGLEDEVDKCTNKLRRAESLISGLGGERARWTKAAEQLQSIYDSLPGDTLISSGIIAYLASVSLTIREICVGDWLSLCKKMKIACSDNFGLIAALGLDHQIQNWHVAGLPRDLFSIENAIIMDNSNRYSLFIDPQDQVRCNYDRDDAIRVIVNFLAGKQVDQKHGKTESTEYHQIHSGRLHESDRQCS